MRVKKISVALKRRIGYVSQEQTFYPWMTAQELGKFVRRFLPDLDAAGVYPPVARARCAAERRSIV